MGHSQSQSSLFDREQREKKKRKEKKRQAIRNHRSFSTCPTFFLAHLIGSAVDAKTSFHFPHLHVFLHLNLSVPYLREYSAAMQDQMTC